VGASFSRHHVLHSAPSAPAAMSKQHCGMLQVERFFPRSCFDSVAVLATALNEFFLFSVFRLRRNFERTKFHKKTCLMLLPKTNGNNVEATLRSALSKETFDLYHSATLLRRCCWCGRGFSKLLLAYVAGSNALCKCV